MICNGKRVVRRKGGKKSFIASKIFTTLWKDDVLRTVYIELCMKTGRDVTLCYEAGPLITRTAVIHMIKEINTPVSTLLKKAIIWRINDQDMNKACQELIKQIYTEENT